MTDEESDSKSIADRLEDILYTGVGLGVLAVNKAQVARRRLQSDVAEADLSPLVEPLAELGELVRDRERLERLAGAVRRELRELDDLVDGLEHRVGLLMDRLEPELPPRLQEISVAVRALAAEHREQIRAALGLDDPEASPGAD